MNDKQESAVEWLQEIHNNCPAYEEYISDEEFEQAKKMEQTIIDNKVIHFAEWLTNKHTTELITLYEQFKLQNETYGGNK
jgi:Ni,Fe-hydrogenase III component G